MNIMHEDAASGLTFRLRPAAGKAAARLFVLHGVGGNETNLLPLADMIDPRVEVAFVRGPLELGAGQHAWFHVRFGPQGPVINAGQADESRLSLRTLVRSMASHDATASMPVLMAGFSQGGILSASVALSSPGDVAGFAVLSGRILPELEPHLAPSQELARLSAYIAHGRLDDKLSVKFAEHADSWLTKLGVPHEMHLYAVGHTLTGEMVGDFSRWVSQQTNLV